MGGECEMPTYDYRCENCRTEVTLIRRIRDRNESIVCNCGGIAKRFHKFTKSRDWFRPHINDDITGEPIEITSKKQYRRVCEENGVMAKCLL